MAGRLILGVANPALDANGNVDSGATLTFWENGTTTLQSVYTAEDLLTPLANPLSCDGAGRFPMVWAPDGSIYTVKWTPTGATPITYDYIFGQAQKFINIEFSIDGGGSVPGTGLVNDLAFVPVACTIVKAIVLSTVSSSIAADIWAAPFVAGSIPTVANTIVGSSPVTLTSSKSSQDATLTSWSKSIAANSVVACSINSVSVGTHYKVVLVASVD